MARGTLLDNWSLQSVGEFLQEGFTEKRIHVLQAGGPGDQLDYSSAFEDHVRFRALCQLLTDIVLSERLIVDASFAEAWTGNPGIQSLRDQGLLIKKPFREHWESWYETREDFAAAFCTTAALKEVHEKNRNRYREEGKSHDEHVAQVLWGGAGMLARAETFDLHYSPHPQRADFIESAGSARVEDQDTASRVTALINESRMQLWQFASGAGLFAAIPLPPVAVLVLRDSSSPQDLFKVSLQLRDEFHPLRQWISCFDQHIESGNLKGAQKDAELLVGVRQDIQKQLVKQNEAELHYEIGFPKALSFGIKGAFSLTFWRQRSRVRSQLHKLIDANVGKDEVRKLFRWYGVKGRQAERLMPILLGRPKG